MISGFSAGASSSGFTLPGGGANLLCMHPIPEWNKYDTQANDTTGYGWVSEAFCGTYLTAMYFVR